MSQPIFANTTFYYSDSNRDFSRIKDLIERHNGLMVTQAALSKVHLLPRRGAAETTEGEFVDITYVDDCVEAGRQLDLDYYIVDHVFPEPYADKRKLAIQLRMLAKQRRENEKAGLPTVNSTARSRSPNHERHVPEQSSSPPNGQNWWLNRGRVPWKDEEAIRMMRYVQTYRNMSPNGHNLWIQAAAEELCGPNKTAQAYESHWKKVITKNWAYYSELYESWIERGTEQKVIV
jgi:hypothetical protein